MSRGAVEQPRCTGTFQDGRLSCKGYLRPVSATVTNEKRIGRSNSLTIENRKKSAQLIKR
ncbi:hypothetical protein [Chamaesiphon polymorphus]|uniref:hypothetical protein n=1 Tax=Chamaesiphon polymorphus TaxID=2107691 RepID=UPI0011B29E59|nr:hypothetical protein [Chamaesiphon polymorphus]